MAKQKLPLGIQDFEELRKGNYLYVDKTDMLWKIANGDKYNFLSRPRRFGKSLLTSAMQCYFEGKKELFEGLKIMALEKEWVKRPVLHFSMNQGGSNAKSLSHYLDDTLSKYEDIYGRRPTEFNPISTIRLLQGLEWQLWSTGRSLSFMFFLSSPLASQFSQPCAIPVPHPVPSSR